MRILKINIFGYKFTYDIGEMKGHGWENIENASLLPNEEIIRKLLIYLEGFNVSNDRFQL